MRAYGVLRTKDETITPLPKKKKKKGNLLTSFQRYKVKLSSDKANYCLIYKRVKFPL